MMQQILDWSTCLASICEIPRNFPKIRTRSILTSSNVISLLISLKALN